MEGALKSRSNMLDDVGAGADAAAVVPFVPFTEGEVEAGGADVGSASSPPIRSTTGAAVGVGLAAIVRDSRG